MKHITLTFFIYLFSNNIYSQSISTTSDHFAYNEDLAGTGIEKVFIFNTLNNVSISFTSNSVSAKFFRYKNTLSDKEQISINDINQTTSGGITTYNILNLKDSYGYFMEDSKGQSQAAWIINYSEHLPILNKITVVEDEDKCTNLKLYIDKTDKLSFYTRTTGSTKDIKRRYKISYENAIWSDNEQRFVKEIVTLPAQTIGTEVIIDAPLSDTQFTIEGDQIAEYFKTARKIQSNKYSAIATQGKIIPEQEENNTPNIAKKTDNETTLGGSAPVFIKFNGYANEPVARFYTWFIFKKEDLKNPIVRYTDRDIEYTFNHFGKYVVMLETADRNSVCADTTTVDVNITDSYLRAPNYFSPGDSPGINDEFRVEYRSLIKFKCTIFNRWGVKLYQWTDPSKGWDGRYKGNYVNTGVYFYVIEAEGSDGQKYTEKGDINILRGK